MNSPRRRSCPICRRHERGTARVLSTKSCDIAYVAVQYQYVDTSPRCHKQLQLVVVEYAVAHQINPVVAWALRISCHLETLTETLQLHRTLFLSLWYICLASALGNEAGTIFIWSPFSLKPSPRSLFRCIVQCIDYKPLLCRVLFLASSSVFSSLCNAML